jgi:hypothetical protein
MPVLDPLDDEFFVNTLIELVEIYVGEKDIEIAHMNADIVLVKILSALELKEHVRYYNKIKKKYA